MLILSPSRKAFLGVFAFSCLAHIAVFGLPLSRQPVPAEQDAAVAGLVDDAPATSAKPIAITTLPLSTSMETHSRALPESEQPVIAPQSLSAQVLPEAPAPPLAEPAVEPVQPPVSPAVPVTPPLVSGEPPQPSRALAPEPEPPEPEPSEPEPSEPEPEQPAPEQLAPERSDPAMIVSVGDNFPHLAGAQGNCYNLSSCYRLSDAGGYRQAAKALAEQMEGQGYTVNEREDIDGAGRRVFEVVMPGAPDDIYFLNVFSDEAGSAVYVLTMDILTLRELQQLRA